MNFIVKDVAAPEDPEGDNVDRRTTPRMPWHDIAVQVQGTAARDVARHFIQRWNAIKSEKAKHNAAYPFLFPRPYVGMGEAADMHEVIGGASRADTVTCQVLRSSSTWSAGIDETESSIHEAVTAAIAEAKHYVYIENQVRLDPL